MPHMMHIKAGDRVVIKYDGAAGIIYRERVVGDVTRAHIRIGTRLFSRIDGVCLTGVSDYEAAPRIVCLVPRTTGASDRQPQHTAGTTPYSIALKEENDD